jgi:hypothetical protein
MLLKAQFFIGYYSIGLTKTVAFQSGMALATFVMSSGDETFLFNSLFSSSLKLTGSKKHFTKTEA